MNGTGPKFIKWVSPLYYSDITALCRVSKNGLVAECFSCWRPLRGGVHLCEVAYGGFFCAACCPSCNGQVVLTEAEMAAMEQNRVDMKEVKRTQRSGTARHGYRQVATPTERCPIIHCG